MLGCRQRVLCSHSACSHPNTTCATQRHTDTWPIDQRMWGLLQSYHTVSDCHPTPRRSQLSDGGRELALLKAGEERRLGNGSNDIVQASETE